MHPPALLIELRFLPRSSFSPMFSPISPSQEPVLQTFQRRRAVPHSRPPLRNWLKQVCVSLPTLSPSACYCIQQQPRSRQESSFFPGMGKPAGSLPAAEAVCCTPCMSAAPLTAPRNRAGPCRTTPLQWKPVVFQPQTRSWTCTQLCLLVITPLTAINIILPKHPSLPPVELRVILREPAQKSVSSVKASLTFPFISRSVCL